MILPIVAYGTPVLKKKGSDITPDYPAFEQLLENMWETMYEANGVGLAAPQVGIAIRLFIVDASPFADDDELTEEEQKQLTGFKKVFINPQIEESRMGENLFRSKQYKRTLNDILHLILDWLELAP